MKHTNQLSNSILQNIIRESINKLLLTEDRGSRSIKSAKNHALEILGNKEEADRLVYKVRNELELHNAAEAFVLGGVRMKLKNQYDDTNKDKLISVIKLIASKYLDKYRNDLNELSAQELITRHFPEVQMIRNDERGKLDPNKYSGKSDYKIVRIDSFKQAREYGRYTSWCVTREGGYYDEYTLNGMNQFYFCLKNGFKKVRKEHGEGYPLDEYGLSMFAVRVNGDGDLIGCTTRWNAGDNAMNVEQISDVIQMSFYDVFKPNTTWRDALANAMQRLANGENPEDVFDEYCDYDNGFVLVSLNGKKNVIKPNGELLSKNLWFDEFHEFREGFATIKRADKWNFINQNGELLSKNQWFEWCDSFNEGFAQVHLIGHKWNFIDLNGEFLWKKPIDQWFEWCGSFSEGFGQIVLNGKHNFINQNGKIAFPDKSFSSCSGFRYGFASVEVRNDRKTKFNFIDRNGEFLWKKPIDQWFEWSCNFTGKFAKVRLNDGEWYYLDRDGNITGKVPQVSESLIRNIIKECVMDYIKKDIIK